MTAAAPAPAFVSLEAPAGWRLVDCISDLHLKADEPATFAAWAHYMAHTRADAVLILGDLFEVWVGDDAAQGDTFEHRCAEVLAACRAEVAFMRGNRDFLVGGDFLSRCGVRDLGDPAVFSWGGRHVVLTHGDLLCTRDLAYQEFRRQVRAPATQAAFLSQPLEQRRAIGRQMRTESEARHGDVPTGERAYTDPDMIRSWLAAADAATLIHGHTHQPADHMLGTDAQRRTLTQVVLSDWHIAGAARRAEVLRLDAAGGWTRMDPDTA